MTKIKFGRFSEYDANVENCQSYVERLKLNFIANDVGDENKKEAVLFYFCGAETYRLFKELTAPGKPPTKRFDELVSLHW